MWPAIQYRLSVWERAFKDTLAFFGCNWETLLVSVLSIPTGLLAHWYVFGRAEATNELLVWSTMVAFPLAAIFVVALLWNLFLAPARIDQEQRETIGSLSSRPTEEKWTDLESRLSAVEQERDVLLSRLTYKRSEQQEFIYKAVNQIEEMCKTLIERQRDMLRFFRTG